MNLWNIIKLEFQRVITSIIIDSGFLLFSTQFYLINLYAFEFLFKNTITPDIFSFIWLKDGHL